MKKYLAILVGVLAILGGSWSIATASGCNPFVVPTGGTGVCAISSGFIPFGNGTSAIATSSGLQYSSTGLLLTVTNASTTDASATVFCLTGDTCRTTWPSSTSPGGTAGQVQYNSNGNALAGVSTTTLAGSGVVTISNSPVVIGSTPAVATVTGGTNGQILGWLSGVPTWVASTTVGNLPNVIYISLAGTKFYEASSTATDNLSWIFKNGYVSQASSTIIGGLTLPTQLSEVNGGTNQNAYVTGDLLYASNTNTLSRRAIGTAGQVLSVSNGIPTWVATSTGVTSLATSGACLTTNASTGAVTLTFLCGYPFTMSTAFGNTVAGTSTIIQDTGGLYASSTVIFGNVGQPAFTFTGSSGVVGLASSTPFYAVSIGAGNGSSSQAFLAAEDQPASTTSMTIDWTHGNSTLVRIASAAVTITFTNFTDGAQHKVVICNPTGGTAGAVTFGPNIIWAGGTAPTQTTTANHCDVWSFIGTHATSTSGTVKIFGTASTNF